MENIYNDLAAKIYCYWYPKRDEAEVKFYEKFIKETNGGVCLEIACGSGQLMIPYLRSGYNVEGFDASGAMLEIARKEAEKAGVKIILYQQKMEELDIGRSYSLLYAPFGAIQHIRSPEDALKAIKIFYSHTSPNGTLLIHMLSPLKEDLDQDWSLTHKTTREDNAIISTYGKNHYDKNTKILTSHYRVIITKDGTQLEKGEWVDHLQFYSQQEACDMLETAGYKVSEVNNSYGPDQTDHPNMIIITAKKI